MLTVPLSRFVDESENKNSNDDEDCCCCCCKKKKNRTSLTKKENKTKHIKEEISHGFTRILTLLSFFIGGTLSNQLELKLQNGFAVVITCVILLVVIKLIVHKLWIWELEDYMHRSRMWKFIQKAANNFWNIIAVVASSSAISILNKHIFHYDDFISAFVLLSIPYLALMILEDFIKQSK